MFLNKCSSISVWSRRCVWSDRNKCRAVISCPGPQDQLLYLYYIQVLKAHRHSATWHSATCHSATWRSAIQTFGHTDIRPHRHLATQSLGHMDTWPHGHSTTWTLGHMDTRPHALWKQTLGHMDTWPHGHSATLSGFSKRKLEPRFKQKNWIFCLESNLEVSI